jgi:lysophospholipase L1-like esterase
MLYYGKVSFCKGGYEMGNHEGNGKQYGLEQVKRRADSPLAGKRILFLGSSVTKGEASLDVSFADYLAARDGVVAVKEAVSGTTLADVEETSYVQRLLRKVDPAEKFDLAIVQLSTNDATRIARGDDLELGKVAAGAPGNTVSAAKPESNGANTTTFEAQSESNGADTTSLEAKSESYDVRSTVGAMEFIIDYVRKTWDCPVFFYTSPRYDSPIYDTMVRKLYELRDKWGIGIIDMWTDEAFNALTEEQRSLYMADPIHPTQAGYLLWWTPYFEASLEAAINGRM